jgi:hypothetical protein
MPMTKKKRCSLTLFLDSHCLDLDRESRKDFTVFLIAFLVQQQLSKKKELRFS